MRRRMSRPLSGSGDFRSHQDACRDSWSASARVFWVPPEKTANDDNKNNREAVRGSGTYFSLEGALIRDLVGANYFV